MNTKICKNCGIEKSNSEFYKHHLCCKPCKRAKNKLYREKEAEKISACKKEYRLKNIERYKEKETRNYLNRDKDVEKIKRRERHQRVLLDPERKKRLKENQKRWALENPDRMKQHRKKHRNTSFYCKYASSLRGRINHFVKNKNFSVSRLVGCSNQELKNHLEKQFKKGMNWDNYGVHGWHIDHIIPLSSARDDIDLLKKLCHYTNLQPLWAQENRIKSNKFPI